MEFILHILEHAFTDTIRLAPFLFLTYLAMEYLENKAGEKTVELLLNTGKRTCSGRHSGSPSPVRIFRRGSGTVFRRSDYGRYHAGGISVYFG